MKWNNPIFHLVDIYDMIRGMSRMSGIMILSYRLKEVINSYVLHFFEIKELFISPEPDV